MGLQYIFQSFLLLSWVFFSVIFSSKIFPGDRLADVIFFICFSSLGFAISLAIPHLWDLHKEKVLKKAK